MSRPENDDAEASTIFGATVSEAPRATERLERLGEGSMIGRYRLKARLGAGAMGVVWSARDPNLDREIAIKLVHPGLASEEASTRMVREAKAMAKLSHRSVITIHDSGEVDGHLFLAMELVRGRTLGQLLRERDAAAIADWRRWLAMLLDAGRGLAEAHQNGVLHRDFKPDNVLVDESGRVCVGDFGLATLGQRDNDPGPSRSFPVHGNPFDLTTTGAILGTPLYMSPQQLNGEAIDARADQFAFCIALHEALYGGRPFAAEAQGLASIPGLIDAIARGAPEPPADSPVPRAFHDAIRRGLAFEPEDRWSGMTTLIAALERASLRAPTAAPPTRRRRWPWLAVPAVAAVTIVVVVATRDGDAPGVAAPPQYESKKLFDVRLRTLTAVSKSGKRIALASDRIEIHSIDPAEKFLRSTALPLASAEVAYLELDDRELRFSVFHSPAIYRYRYAGDGSTDKLVEDVGGTWLGNTVKGPVVLDHVPKIWIVDGATRIPVSTVGKTEWVEVSADGRRVAFNDVGRIAGKLVVYSVEHGTRIERDVDELTTLSWRNANELIYATGTTVTPAIFSIPVSPAGFGTPTKLFERESGWFGRVSVVGDRMFTVELKPVSRGRVFERGDKKIVRRDLDRTALAIGWTRDNEMLLWNRTTKRLETTTRLPAIELPLEPVNSTMAGDVLIATLRGNHGRTVVAVSLVDGKQRWAHVDNKVHTVRCAGDRAAPCFAVLPNPDRVVPIDIATGEVGAVVYTGLAEDIAVSDTGERVIVVGNTNPIREIDAKGTLISEQFGPLSALRSVAYDPAGGLLLGGTLQRNSYSIGRFHAGAYETYDEAGDDILLLVRPSPDRQRVSLLARQFQTEVFELSP